MNITRRQAIFTLVSMLPGAALAANRPIQLGNASVATMPPPRYAAIFRADGPWEIPLDNWPCLRVTLGGESVEFSPAELFAALREERP